MCQCCAFRKPGRAACKLNIDRVVRLQLCSQHLELGKSIAVNRLFELREPEHARYFGLSQLNDVSQCRNFGGIEVAGLAVTNLRRQLTQHGKVIAGLEAFRNHERLARHLVQNILELGYAVGRIDGNEDRADSCTRQLGQDPLRIVWRPDADAVSFFDPQCKQIACNIVYGLNQFGVRQPDILMANNKGFVFRIRARGFLQRLPDGFV